MLDFRLLLPIIFFIAAIVTCWVRAGLGNSKAVPLILFSIAICFGLHQGTVDFIAIPFILLILVCCSQISKTQTSGNSIKRLMTHGIFVTLAILSSYHLLPGFHNPILLHNIVLGPNCPPYTLYANFDKALIGFGILLFICPLLDNGSSTYACMKMGLPIFIGTLVVVLGLCVILNVVLWTPKAPTMATSIFFPVNLFFTCIAEEACFRGYLQQKIHKLFTVKNLFASCMTIMISGALFGLAHWGGGISYVAVASLAGIGYAWVHQRTGRIEASIFTHFLLNSIHFQLFTYPYALNSP